MIYRIKSIYRFLSPKFQSLHLEYKVTPRPRYGHGKPPHGMLYEVISRNRDAYFTRLRSFENYFDTLTSIQERSVEKNMDNPAWNNEYLPGLDIIGLYCMLCEFKPSHYIEVGSGNSTQVARKAIKENNLHTKITSIDPYPRANIDHLADEVIRKPFENLDEYQTLLTQLGPNDILFIDNSHRLFPNSDVMIFFLEILPYLKKGVVVQIHDIYLPYDYPQFMCDRFYNEQYVLATALLSNPDKYEVLLPNYYISQEPDLHDTLQKFWQHPNLANVEKHGGSFWLRVK